MQSVLSSGALSTAQAVKAGAGKLTFARYCSAYEGSTSGTLLAQCSTADTGPPAISFDHPVQFGSTGLWVVPTSTSINAIVHYI